MLKKLYWALARGLFLFFAFSGMFTFGLIVFPLGPVYSWYFCNDINPLKYYRRTFLSVFMGFRTLGDVLFNGKYSGSFLPRFTDPPLLAPKLSNIRISKKWTGPVDTCDGCVRCCLERRCPLIDLGSKKCLSYGSFFWRYFNCGRYPENRGQIEYYDCPKWEMN